MSRIVHPRAIKTHLKHHGFRIVTPSVPLVRHWWGRINFELWDGALPRPHAINIRHDRKAWAYTAFPEEGKYALEVDAYPLTKKRFIEVLTHESVHAYLWIVEGDGKTVHGPAFMRHRHKVRYRLGISLTHEIRI